MADTAKLSKLQRSILTLAYERRDRDRPLYYAEILAEVFDFPVSYYADSLAENPGSQHFSRERIGAGRYDAAQASLSRAVRRLADRGLVEIVVAAYSRWTGLSLTEEAVKSGASWRSPNQIDETVGTPADLQESQPFASVTP
jgi:hypothetical protein